MPIRASVPNEFLQLVKMMEIIIPAPSGFDFNRQNMVKFVGHQKVSLKRMDCQIRRELISNRLIF